MQYDNILNTEFFKNTIFVVSCPQEAVGLLLIAKAELVEYCILVKYRDCTDGVYSEITKRILEEVNVKNMYVLSLYSHQVSMERGNIFSSINEVFCNKQIINKFNKIEFRGGLYKRNYNFVTPKDCPILTLSRYDISKIYMLEHTPKDSAVRLAALINKTKSKSLISEINVIIEKFSAIYQSKLSVTADKRTAIYKAIKVGVAFKIINIMFPHMKEMRCLDKGFSWIHYGDKYIYMDYRDLDFKIKYTRPNNEFDNVCKTIILIDHKESYKNSEDLYTEMKTIDFVEMYAKIIEKHVEINECIIIKFHPYVLQNANTLEVKEYSCAIKKKFASLGYHRVYSFEDLLPDLLFQLMPVEIFINIFKVNKIVGLWSSTHMIVQYWDGISVISDCTGVKVLRQYRDKDMEIFPSRYIQAYP